MPRKVTVTSKKHAAAVMREMTTFLRLTAALDLHTNQGVRNLENSTFSILDLLGSTDSMRPGQIAIVFRLGQSTMTRHIQELERLGLVQKTTDPMDRRAVLVSLSKSGREVLAAETELRQNRLAREMASWSAHEKSEFARLLASINQNIVARREADAVSSA